MVRLTITGCALLAMVGTAQGAMVNIMGDTNTSIENTGASFTGTLNYSFVSGTSGTLVVTLNNTSASSVGGYLTGFVFNIASADSGASATLSSATNTNFLDTGTESASPFGTFDAGAALGANWTGGGSPNGGLLFGTGGTFTFTVSASDASTLSSVDFLGDGDDFAVRFKGLANGGSDKILGNEVNVVPLPAGVLAGAGLLGMCLGVRTLRRRA